MCKMYIEDINILQTFRSLLNRSTQSQIWRGSIWMYTVPKIKGLLKTGNHICSAIDRNKWPHLKSSYCLHVAAYASHSITLMQGDTKHYRAGTSVNHWYAALRVLLWPLLSRIWAVNNDRENDLLRNNDPIMVCVKVSNRYLNEWTGSPTQLVQNSISN